jgi:phytoene dehydrogenase-like protein
MGHPNIHFGLERPMKPRKVLIIGGGIAGLCTGVYLRKNGFETEILEMNAIAGGLATAWKRDGYTFENCIHWLLGSREGDELNATWKEVFDVGRLEFYNGDIYQVIEKDGRSLTVYRDVDRMEKEFLARAPEDAAAIREFARVVRKLSRFRLPGGDSLVRRIISFARALPYFVLIGRCRKDSMARYAERFANPLLRSFFASAPGDLSFVAIALSLAWMTRHNAGYPIGGSLKMIGAIEDHYRKLGGSIRFGCRVAKIIVKDNRAAGVVLEGGEELAADVVVSAADGHATLYELLEGRFMNDRLRHVYSSYKLFSSYVQVSLGIAADLSGEPEFIGLHLDREIAIDPETREHFLAFRVFNFDPTFAPAGKTAVVCFLPTYNYEYWVSLRSRDKAAYDREKERVAREIVAVCESRFPAARGNIEHVDVATPATVIRYTGNWKGSMEGWLLTPAMGFRQLTPVLPGLKGFYMAGQWLSPGGGLPSGLLTARVVSHRICRDFHVKWQAA